VAPPRWELAIGELVVGGHRGTMAERGGERGRDVGHEWAALALLGQAERGRPRERERRARVRVGRAHASSWAVWAEREEERYNRPVMTLFVFLFLQMLNSNNFCLFCCELFRIAKMVKIIM
jgi:hypothetical protein